MPAINSIRREKKKKKKKGDRAMREREKTHISRAQKNAQCALVDAGPASHYLYLFVFVCLCVVYKSKKRVCVVLKCNDVLMHKKGAFALS